MPKCSSCTKNECKGEYKNREKCLGKKEGIECICICQITPGAAVLQKAVSIGAGGCLVTMGVGATVMGSSALALAASAAIFSIGASLILNPFVKMITNEQITAKETVKDVLVSGTIGAVTSPLGGGFIAKAVKVGAVSGAVNETSRALSGEEVTAESVIKSVSLGAAVGLVAGSSSKTASKLTDKAGDLTKAVTRVAAQGVSAAATDAGIQYCQTGSVDLKQTTLMTVGQVVVAGTAERKSMSVQRTPEYAEKVNNQLIDENITKDNLSRDQAQEIKEQFKALNDDKIKLQPGSKVGDKNAHILDDRANSKRGGQVAIDIGSTGDNGSRGAGRAIGTKINGKYIYVDHTAEHDYKGCKETVKLRNPIEGLKVVNVGEMLDLIEENEEEKVKKE